VTSWQWTQDALGWAIYSAVPESTHTEPENYVFAGMIALKAVSRDQLLCSLSAVMITQAFRVRPHLAPPAQYWSPQGTHVLNHAFGLLAQYAFNLPRDGGLGFRRLQWDCSALNVASVKAAVRLGFKSEGTIINHAVWLPGKIAARGESVSACRRVGCDVSWRVREEGREGDGGEGRLSGDVHMLGMTWQDWEGGVKEHVRGLMVRKW
jgi:hypothetical protein